MIVDGNGKIFEDRRKNDYDVKDERRNSDRRKNDDQLKK